MSAIPAELLALVEQALEEMEAEIEEALVENGLVSAASGAAGAEQSLSGAINWDQVNQAALAQLEAYAAQLANGGSDCAVQLPDGSWTVEFVAWFADFAAGTQQAVVDAIQQAIESGAAIGATEGSQGYQPGSLAEALSGLFDEYKSQAATIARTEMSKIRNEAALERYRQAGIERVEWTGGDSPCDDCDPMVGETFPIDDCPPIPLHPNCECGWIPVVPIGEERYI